MLRKISLTYNKRIKHEKKISHKLWFWPKLHLFLLILIIIHCLYFSTERERELILMVHELELIHYWGSHCHCTAPQWGMEIYKGCLKAGRCHSSTILLLWFSSWPKIFQSSCEWQWNNHSRVHTRAGTPQYLLAWGVPVKKLISGAHHCCCNEETETKKP